MEFYHPIVFWGQSKEYIILSIKIINAKNVIIKIEEENIKFTGEGEGASGMKPYSFEFQYYLPIIPNSSSWKIKENFVEVKLKKELKDPWPRLTSKPMKYAWLKCDFNNFFFDESDYGSDDSVKESKNSNLLSNLKIPKEKAKVGGPENFFNGLLLYNMLFKYFSNFVRHYLRD